MDDAFQEETRKYYKACGYMAGSALFATCLGTLLKLLTGQFQLFFLIFLRFFCPFILMIPFFLYKGTFRHLKSNTSYRLQLSRAFSMIISQYIMVLYFRKASLFSAAIMAKSTVIFIPLLSCIFLKHKITRATALSLLIGLVGLFFVFKPDKGIFDPWTLLGLLGGVLFSYSHIVYGILAKQERNDVNLFYMFLKTSALSGLAYLASIFMYETERITSFTQFTPSVSYLILGLAVFTFSNQMSQGLAYAKARPSALSVLGYLAVIFALFFDWLIFARLPDMYAIFGCVLVLASSAIKIFTKEQEQVLPLKSDAPTNDR